MTLNKLETRYIDYLKKMNRLVNMKSGECPEYIDVLTKMIDRIDILCQEVENKISVKRHQELTSWYYRS